MATLVTQLSESLVLHGKEEGSIKTTSFSDINEVFRRTVTIKADSDPHTIVVFASDPDELTAYKLNVSNIKYIRITNLSINTVGLILNGSSTACAYSLGACKSMSFNNTLIQGDSTTGNINAVPSEVMSNIEIEGVTTSTSDIELFIASS